MNLLKPEPQEKYKYRVWCAHSPAHEAIVAQTQPLT